MNTPVAIMVKRGPYKTGPGHGNSIEAKAKKDATGYISVWKLVNTAIQKVKKNAKTRRQYSERSEEERLRANAATLTWQQGNGKEKKREYMNTYFLSRRDTDENFRLATNMRTRVRYALKYQGTNKAGEKTFGPDGLVGCTKEEFHAHLRTTFTDEMRADNTDVDHIWPLALYDLRDPVQQKMAFNWQNCQAMWPKENKLKKDKIPSENMALKVPRHLWPLQCQHLWQ